MPDALQGEVLLRNVAPVFYDPDVGELAPGAIWPNSQDEGLLSTDRDSIWTAEESLRFRTNVVGLPSRGVVSLESDELANEWGILTKADPLAQGVGGALVDNPAHALSDFTGVLAGTPSERRKVREALLAKVVARGWVIGPAVSK